MKVIITGAIKGEDKIIEVIRERGNEVFFMQNENGELPISPCEVDGVVCNGLFLYHDIKKFTSLKFIQLTSAGFDRVPMDYIEQKGIKVFNARGVYSIPMAEYALWGVLSLYKRAVFFQSNKQQKKWCKHREIPELYGKKVLIVGCGSVGMECAKRFKGFGCEVFGVDRIEKQDCLFEKIYAINDLSNALKIADVVVLTLPLTSKTKGLFNESTFAKMKTGSVFVNIARGAIVEERALIESLKSKLFGAVLDVFEEEPLRENSELWDLENAIITPHNSFVGEGNSARLHEVILGNIKGIL